MNGNAVTTLRRYELDWLRALAILAVFIFHSLRFFDLEDWHLKNSIIHGGMQPVMKFFIMWIMPLIFVISGAGVFFALGKRKVRAFIKARILRLAVPLSVGIFTHVMWQVYLEQTSHGRFQGSFLEFVPRYFDGMYAFGGNFAWMGLHLWYLELLFLFSMILLPLFAWLRKGTGRRVLSWLGNRLFFPGFCYLLAAPIILLLVLPNPDSLVTARAFGGWSVATCIFFFMNGFLLVSDERLHENVKRLRWISLASGAVLAIGLAVWFSRSGEPVFGTSYYTKLMALYGLGAWCWVLAILGFGAKRLNSPKPYLAYINEAVLPFYVMHQTVLLAVGNPVLHHLIPDALKWAIIAMVSLAICALLYELLVRRIKLLRFLFGMRPKTLSIAWQPTTMTRSHVYGKNSPEDKTSAGQIPLGSGRAIKFQ